MNMGIKVYLSVTLPGVVRLATEKKSGKYELSRGRLFPGNKKKHRVFVSDVKPSANHRF